MKKRGLMSVIAALALPLCGQQSVPVEFSFSGSNGLGSASFAWSTDPGTYYEILATTNLNTGVWSNVVADPIPATNLIAQMELLTTNPAAFFRVRTMDTTGPQIVSRYPNPDGSGVGLSTPLMVSLSDPSGLNTNSYRLVINGGAALTPGSAGVVTYTNGFTYTPSSTWGSYGSTVNVAVTSMDMKGNPSVEEWFFTLEVLPDVATNLIHLASAQPMTPASAVSRSTMRMAAAQTYADALTIVEVRTNSIVFDYGAGGHGLYTGAILISHDLANFFYRRITSLDDDPANYRVIAWTVEVPLTEVVKEGSFSSENVTLPQGSMAMADGV